MVELDNELPESSSDRIPIEKDAEKEVEEEETNQVVESENSPGEVEQVEPPNEVAVEELVEQNDEVEELVEQPSEGKPVYDGEEEQANDVTSTPSKSEEVLEKVASDNVDSTCEEGPSLDPSSNGTRESNEVSSTYEAYEESIPDYSVDLKCAVSSCSTIDSFTTPESRTNDVTTTPASDSSEVVSSQDNNRSLTDGEYA